MRIQLTAEQVERLQRRLGIRGGLEFYGLPIGHHGSVTRTFSDTAIGRFLARDLLQQLQTLDLTARPDRATDRTQDKPIWLR